MKLVGIEAGRGIAASLVVALHTYDHLTAAFGHGSALGRLFKFGHAGVDFFFVLSGFIILHVHAGDIGRALRIRHYLSRRLTRIYPFYLLAFSATLAAAALSTHQAFPGPARIVESALLLPISVDPILGVSWTLQHEVLFYAAFALLILNQRAGLAALALWLAATAAALAWGRDLRYLSVFDTEFFFGMAAAWALRRARIPRPRALLAAGILAFLAIGGLEDAGLAAARATASHLAYAAAAAAIVLGLVEAERSGNLAVPRALATSGSASYAIYLTHILTIGVCWQIMLGTKLDRVLPVWLDFVILVTTGILGGIFIAGRIERPLLRALR